MGDTIRVLGIASTTAAEGCDDRVVFTSTDRPDSFWFGSTNASVASVSSNGLVTAHSAGFTEIAVVLGGRDGQQKVGVTVVSK
jgi:hypothetical protein